VRAERAVSSEDTGTFERAVLCEITTEGERAVDRDVTEDIERARRLGDYRVARASRKG
jgi:ribosomal protein S13